MSIRYADCSSYFTQALAKAKVEGRRALPRDVVVASACDRFPDFLTEEHVAKGLDALLADGTFKLTAGGKIALGKTREMQRAIAANGFERALDLSCDILAHVLSFADVKTLSASEIASRSLSTHASRPGEISFCRTSPCCDLSWTTLIMKPPCPIGADSTIVRFARSHLVNHLRWRHQRLRR